MRSKQRKTVEQGKEDEVDDVVQQNLEHNAKPFNGFVVSCTGLDEDERVGPEENTPSKTDRQTALYKKAQQMGAETSPDLTSQVTHLITNSIGTEKYKYAVQFRIPIMKEDWVAKTHERWINGDDIDIEEITKNNVFPPLHGLRICCTGLDPELRDWIAQKSGENGAQHSPDFTKKCTHLVAAKPEGKKYEHAQRWGTQIVRAEWIIHSVELGACQDELKYRLDVEPPRLPAPMEAETIPLRKRKSPQDEQELAERFKLRHKRKDSKFDVNDIIDGLRGRPNLIQKDSFAKVGPTTPLKRSNSVSNAALPSLVEDEATSQSTMRSDSGRISSKEIFKGLVFAFEGFSDEQGDVLEQELRDLGGTIVDINFVSPGRYVIVPFKGGAGYTASSGETVVTERWVEACINRERVCLPAEHVLYAPLMNPVKLLDGCVVGTTGFDELQRRELEVLVREMGGQHTEGFNKANTHLITKEGSGAKFTRAQKLKIPCLKDKWLYDAVNEGSLPEVEAYRVYPSSGKENSALFSVPSRVSDRKPLKSRNSGIVNTFLKKDVDGGRRNAPPNRRRPAAPLSPLSRAMIKPAVGLCPAPPFHFVDEPSVTEGAITYDDPDAEREKEDLLSMLKEKREARSRSAAAATLEILSEGENDVAIDP